MTGLLVAWAILAGIAAAVAVVCLLIQLVSDDDASWWEPFAYAAALWGVCATFIGACFLVSVAV